MSFMFSDVVMKRGTVVACRFPDRLDPDAPGPKTRPALVLAIIDGPIPGFVVVPGTKKMGSCDGRVNLKIRDARDIKSAGLDQPTCFRLLQPLFLPRTDAFFPTSRDGTPVFGHIGPAVLPILKTKLAYTRMTRWTEAEILMIYGRSGLGKYKADILRRTAEGPL